MMWHNINNNLPTVKETSIPYFYMSDEVLVTDGKSCGVGVYVIDDQIQGEKQCYWETSLTRRTKPEITHWTLMPDFPKLNEV